MLKGQLERSREHHELLQRQLGDAQIELDVVYEVDQFTFRLHIETDLYKSGVQY